MNIHKLFRNGRWIALLVLLTSLLLVACRGTEQGKVRYKVHPGYTSIGEVATASGYALDDMSQDQVVEFLNTTWAGAKYQTLSAGETNTNLTAGYVEADALRIPVGKIGILVWDSRVVIIPPRTYSNIPSIDDEIQIVDALYVAPGQIAWRLTSSGQLEHRYAQEVHYLSPARDWTVESSLIVLPGQMATQQKVDGTYEFLSPGQYPQEIASTWQLMDPVQIGPNQFGIYIAGEDDVVYLPPNVYYDKLPNNVIVFQRGTLRYRTLDANVMQQNPNPTDPACSSVFCDYAITRVVVKNSNRDATVNVDILFRFVEDPIRIDQYRFVGSMIQAVQDYIATPSRTHVRSYGSQFESPVLRTPEGLGNFGVVLLTALQDNIDAAGIPIVIETVSIRSIDLNDAELREAAYAAEISATEAQARIDAAQSELAALAAEDSVRQAHAAIDQAEFERWLDNNQQLLEAIATSGLTWQQLWVLFGTGIIDLQLGPDGQLVAPGSGGYYFPQPPQSGQGSGE